MRNWGFFRQVLDLPLGERTPTRWIGWLALAFVGVAVFAAALAAAASTAARREALQPVLVTVLLPVRDGQAPTEAEVARVVAGLGAIPGVAFARPVAAGELGLEGGRPEAAAVAAAPDAAMPLPRFIDLALNPGRPVDVEALGARVAEIAPEAKTSLGARDPAREAALLPAGTLRDLALAAAFAALSALAAAVAVLTRLSLVLHRDTIDLLRQLGADDGYIARQLGQHALTQVLRGGFVGFLIALPGVLALTALARERLPPLDLVPLDWLALGTLPSAAAVLARLVAGLAARPRARAAG